MTRSLQAVAYTRPSVLESAPGGRRLGLETSRGTTPAGMRDHPRFFAGFLTSPQVAAAGLLAIADVAAARHYQRQLRASLDPSARALVAAGAVVLDGAFGTVTAEDGHIHRVRDDAGTLSCSRRCWAKYRGGRGPCKHALAVRMVRREAPAEPTAVTAVTDLTELTRPGTARKDGGVR
ncbi:hypothetical protein OG762_05490 [Streptomyces sp. NBC_01136]|nr:hypothetical protein OG762_05490 [Streptomyces sp. NBC_01136]